MNSAATKQASCDDTNPRPELGQGANGESRLSRLRHGMGKGLNDCRMRAQLGDYSTSLSKEFDKSLSEFHLPAIYDVEVVSRFPLAVNELPLAVAVMSHTVSKCPYLRYRPVSPQCKGALKQIDLCSRIIQHMIGMIWTEFG